MDEDKNYYIVPPCLFDVLPLFMDEIEPFNLNQTLSGKLTPHMTPYVKIWINGVEWEAALDTGAYQTHIGSMAAKALNLQADGETMGKYPVVGHTLTNIYTLNYIVKGVENLFTDKFIELPFEYSFPIILGSKFIGRCKEFNITPESRSFVLKL
tara:strand:+ start:63 stop:524 length:462 start_codon:yes stop_codon:yes gene_type:complete